MDDEPRRSYYINGYWYDEPSDVNWTKDNEYTQEQLEAIADKMKYDYWSGQELVDLYDNECEVQDFEALLIHRMTIAEEEAER